MLKLLRRLMSAGPDRAPRSRRPTAATTDILSGRTTPVAPSRSSSRADGVEFDPYNTGAFDRSSSWERVSKRDF